MPTPTFQVVPAKPASPLSDLPSVWVDQAWMFTNTGVIRLVLGELIDGAVQHRAAFLMTTAFAVQVAQDILKGAADAATRAEEAQKAADEASQPFIPQATPKATVEPANDPVPAA